MFEWSKKDKDLISEFFQDTKLYSLSVSDVKVSRDATKFDNYIFVASKVRRTNLSPIYAFWNGQVHKGIHTGSTATLSFGSSAKKAISSIGDYEIQVFYKELTNVRVEKGYHEKVVLVGEKALRKFLANFDEYMYEYNDCKDDFKIVYATPTQKPKTMSVGEITNRCRYNSSRLERDPRFKNAVQSMFDNTCMVCGCTTTEVLQAAHIIAVADGGSDDPMNGFCLCANHHLMYDAKSLIIDEENGTFRCNDEYTMQTEWYKSCEKNGFKLAKTRNV